MDELNKQGIKYDNAISIGEWCSPASLLKEMKIRNFSTPFEWLFSKIGMVNECIEDNFQLFLDKNQYISSGKKQCHHIEYEKKYKVPILFNHHNLTNEEDYQHFVRRTNRFMECINSDTPLLYLHIGIPNIPQFKNFSSHGIPDIEQLEKFASKIKCEESKIISIHLLDNKSKDGPIVNIIRNENKLLIIEINTTGGIYSDTTMVNKNLIIEIIQKYKK